MRMRVRVGGEVSQAVGEMVRFWGTSSRHKASELGGGVQAPGEHGKCSLAFRAEGGALLQ